MFDAGVPPSGSRSAFEPKYACYRSKVPPASPDEARKKELVTEEALGQLVRQWITEHGRADGTEMAEMADDQDLLASGALDSMGFIELLAYAETVTGQPLGLQELDLDACASIHGLVQTICRTTVSEGER